MILRLDAAWWAGVGISAVSAVLALPKGIAISEATLLSFLVISLVLSRKQFTRRASLFSQPFTIGWLVSIGAVIAGMVGLLLFVYRDVAYTQELWWQFEFDAHAPRSLRALVAVAVLALAFAAQQLLRPRTPRFPKPDAETLQRAATIISKQSSADACVALT